MLRSGEISDFCDVALNCVRGDPYLFLHILWVAARTEGLRCKERIAPVSGLTPPNRWFRSCDAADAAGGLQLEITESLIMQDVSHSIVSLLAIRALGVTIRSLW